MLYERSLGIEQRLRTLVGLLCAGGHSTPGLAKRLGVSVPTASRCLAALRRRGYTIRPVRRPGEWVYELVSEPEAVPQG